MDSGTGKGSEISDSALAEIGGCSDVGDEHADDVVDWSVGSLDDSFEPYGVSLEIRGSQSLLKAESNTGASVADAFYIGSGDEGGNAKKKKKKKKEKSITLGRPHRLWPIGVTPDGGATFIDFF